jgi:AcrR family transcriptional regulator
MSPRNANPGPTADRALAARSRGRREQEKHQTQAKILVAARRLFLKEGVEAVSMRKIARAIRYTPAAIYVHFQDKDALVRALMGADFALFGAALREAGRETDPVERLRGIGRAYVRFALEHPHHYRLMFMNTLRCPDPAECAQAMDNPEEHGYAFLRATVADCIRGKRFGPAFRDLDQASMLCWAGAHGVVSLYIAHGEDPWVPWPDPLATSDAMLDALIASMTHGAPAGPGDAEKVRGVRR